MGEPRGHGFLGWILLSAVAACGNEATSGKGGGDASMPDAASMDSTTLDAPDAAAETDSGAQTDAAAQTDAGPQTDASDIDAGLDSAAEGADRDAEGGIDAASDVRIIDASSERPPAVEAAVDAGTDVAACPTCSGSLCCAPGVCRSSGVCGSCLGIFEGCGGNQDCCSRACEGGLCH